MRFIPHFVHSTHVVSFSENIGSYFHLVMNVEVVNTSNVSDIVFPAVASELDNFTAVEMNNTAQITIPAEAVTKLSAANRSEG